MRKLSTAIALVFALAATALAAPATNQATPAGKPLAPLLVGDVVNLPKGVYRLDKTFRLTTPKQVIHGNGSTIIAPPTAEAFIYAAPHVTVDGFAIPAADVALRAEAPFGVVSNCQIGIGSPNSSVHQAFITGPNGTDFTMINCQIGVTGTVSYYADRDRQTIRNTLFLGSLGEYCVRGETPDGKTIPSGFVIDGCEIGRLQNSVNGEGKDSVGMRMFHNVSITGSTIHRDIRWGQGNQPATTIPGQFASGSVENCTFVDAHLGLPYVVLYQGATVSVLNNRFVSPLNVSIVCGSQSSLTTGGNTNELSHGSKAYAVVATIPGGKTTAQKADAIQVNIDTNELPNVVTVP